MNSRDPQGGSIVPKASEGTRPPSAGARPAPPPGPLDGRRILCVVSHHYGSPAGGGVSAYVDQWTGSLLSRNAAEIHLVAPRAPGPPPAGSPGRLSSTLIEPGQFAGRVANLLSAEIRRRRPDLLVVQTPLQAILLAAVSAAARERIPAAALLHFAPPHLDSALTQDALSRFDVTAGVSRALAARLGPQAIALPPILDLGFWSLSPAERAQARIAVRAEHQLGERFVVLMPHRLEPRKGQMDAILAWRRLLPSAGHHPVLVLLGPCDQVHFRESLVRQVRSFAMGPSVLLLPGAAPESLRDWYAASDLVLCPVHFEPLGLVALEAQAMGTPVVASRVDGVPETLEDGVTGFLVPPRDPQALAEAVLGLVRDRAQLLGFAKAGPAWVLERYEPERMARLHEDFLAGAIAKG